MKTAKELAGELGLIRKRTFSQSTGGMKSLKPIAQKFGYLIVIDFESTCWKDRRGGDQEIIEFPAVLLNTSTGNIETEFHTYCLPEENPILSSFCTELTGITQQQVENGIPLFLCLKKFNRWLKQLETEKKLAFNSSSDPTAKLCTFVTWSDWDLSICLHHECQRKQLIMPQPLRSWIDLKATYRKFYKRTPQGLEGALKDVGIEFAGRQHSGLDDAKNTANLAWRMICDGCDMKITRTLHSKYKSGPSKTEQLPKSAAKRATSCPNGFSSHDQQSSASKNILREQISGSASINTVQVIGSDSNSDQKLEGQKQGTAENHLFGQRQETETANEPACHQHSIIPISNQFQKKSIKTLGVRTASTLNKSFQGTTAAPHPERMEKIREYQPKIFQKASSLVTVNNVISKTETGLSSTTGRMPSSVVNMTSAMTSANENEPFRKVTATDFKTPEIQRKPVSSKGLSHSTGSLGAIKTAGIRRNCKSANNTPTTSMGNSSKTMNSALKTIFSPKSYRTPETGAKRVKMSKVTPPLCNCGKRTRRKTVFSPGPNQGRNFFSCCNRRQIKQTGLRDVTNYGGGCNFFCWESVILSELKSHQILKQSSTVACGGK